MGLSVTTDWKIRKLITVRSAYSTFAQLQTEALDLIKPMEDRTGLEPMMEDLQSSALANLANGPGYGSLLNSSSFSSGVEQAENKISSSNFFIRLIRPLIGQVNQYYLSTKLST